MPTIPTSRQSNGTYISSELDSTSYTWSDTRDASSGNGFVPLQPTSMGPSAIYQSGGRGNKWIIQRAIFGFDFSGVSGTITGLTLKLYKDSSYTNYLDAIVVKNSNTWTNYPDNSDYSVDFSTPYSSTFSMPSGGAGTLKNITLNSDARTDAVSNSDFNIAVVEKDHDYDDSAPSGTTINRATFYYYDLNYYPRIEYTAVTGYGNTISGVVAANVSTVTGVPKINIGNINGAL